ncbi:MAG: glycosyltransferase [Vicinamibacterales bacterium]
MPPFPSGAAMRGDSVVSALVPVLGSRGYRIEVVTAAGDPKATATLSIQVLPGADVDNAAGKWQRLGGELLLGWRAGRRITRGGPAAALISSPAFLSAMLVTGWCRVKRVPYVLEVRDVYPQVYAHAGLLRETSLAYRLLLALSKSMYRHALRIVAATEGLRSTVAPLAGDVSVSCVYNGYPAALLRLRPAKHERFTLCFHGVLGFFQDVESVYALAQALHPHDIDVVVIGYGRKESVLTARAQPNLRFLGRLPFERTMAEAARCHVGLCLRMDDAISRDAFPIKVWEYLGLGMPSIVTPVCEAGDFIERRGCGVQLPAGDVDALVRTARSMRDDPAQFAAMRGRCDAAAEGFTRERLGADVARLVGATLDDASTGRTSVRAEDA